jgi:hypothetical protein
MVFLRAKSIAQTSQIVEKAARFNRGRDSFIARRFQDYHNREIVAVRNMSAGKF